LGGIVLAKKKIELVVEELVAPILESNGFELVDIEYLKEGPNWYLRVYIDKPNGITVDDCQVVSEYLSDELDRVDPIKNSYILEVSSPGVERPLKKEKDFHTFAGREVDIKLYSPMEGAKEHSGVLIGLNDGIVTIETENGKIDIPMDRIASAKLAFKF
jgi:ribosome maturation factor RimP